MKTNKLFLLAGVCLAALAIGAAFHHGRHAAARGSVGANGNDVAARRHALEAYGKIPLTFEANSGQTDSRVKFLARGAGYTVFLTDRDATLRLEEPSAQPGKRGSEAVVRLALAGGNSHPVAHAVGEQVAHASYFVGNDPQKWRPNVPEYARVKFDAVYPGVDLVYYGSQGRLESDYIVSPGANPNRIALRVEGAEHVSFNTNGDAILSTVAGEVSLHQPVAYQENGAGRTEIAANYTQLASGELGIRIGAYDATLPLVIDPVVGYATYLSGSNSGTTGNAIAVDSTGNTYIVGTTGATDFPTTAGAYQTTRTGTNGNAFVTKLNSTGTALVFSTYLGGSGQTGKFDNALGVAVDASGNVYITGATPSTDFPVTSGTAYQLVNNGTPSNGFLTELNPTGTSLMYSTFLGGSGNDSCAAIALDSNGNAYVTGSATSTNFPVTPATAIQTAGQSTGLAFVSRFNTTFSGTGSLIYSTLLGGTSSNQGTGIAVDSSLSAYITGQTTSTNFPVTTSAFQSTMKGTAGNAFVARVDTTTANNLLYATYLGGTATGSGSGDIGTAIALGPSSNVFVTGNTKTSDFPVTTGVLQSTPKNTNETTFVARLDTTKSNAASLLYSTYLGGSSQDAAGGIAADSSGNAYVAGSTASSDFPTIPGAPQFTRTTQNRPTGYVSVVNPTASALSFSTYFGGSGGDEATGVAIDSTKNVYITGVTASSDFPVTTGAYQTTFSTGAAFVAKLSPSAATGVILSPTALNFGKVAVGLTSQPLVATLANLSTSALTITKVSTAGTNAADFTIGNSTCTGSIAVGATCSISVTFTPSLQTAETATLTITDSDASSPQTVPLTGTGTAPPSPVFLSPATVNFGNQNVSTTSTAQTVTLKNNSTATVSNIAVTITGTGATSFAQTSACGATLAAGANCTISVTFTPTATGAVTATLSVSDSDASSPQTATLTGIGTTTSPDFTIGVTPATLSFAAGSTGTATVGVLGLNGYTTAVALTCTGAPAGSTCTLNPNSVTPSTTPVTSTVTITTTARTTTSPSMAPHIGSRPTTGIWNTTLALAALSLLLFVWFVRRIGSARKLAWTFGVLLMLSLTSCSGLPITGTPAGTYPITITGTSGTLTHTATITLTVS